MTRKKKLYECTCCGKLSDEVLFCKTHDTFSNCILPKRKRRCNIIICDSCYSHLTHIQWLVHKYGNFDILYKLINGWLDHKLAILEDDCKTDTVCCWFDEDGKPK